MSIEFHQKKGGSAPGDNVPPEFRDRKLIHICEVCGKRELLTPAEGFAAGWDYAPYMFQFGVVSPRTCSDCTVEKTAWWAVALEHKRFEELTKAQQETILRIHNEPQSILLDETHSKAVLAPTEKEEGGLNQS